MYIFVVFCLHVTKSIQISNIFKLTRGPTGAFCEHYVFAAAQREQAKRASYLLIIDENVRLCYNNNNYIMSDKCIHLSDKCIHE